MVQLQIVEYDFYISMALENVAQAEKHQRKVQSKLTELREKYGKELSGKLIDLESLTLAEVRALIQDVTTFIDLTEKERIELTFKSRELQKKILSYEENIMEYERELSAIQGITDTEREKLYSLLADAGEARADEAFWRGMLIAFLIGTLSSIIAVVLIRKYDRINFRIWLKMLKAHFNK